MSEIDAKVRFFLEHQKDIEAWYALRQNVIIAANAFFQTLDEPVRVLAATLVGNPEIYTDFESGIRQVALYRPAWIHSETTPCVSVGFYWDSGSLFNSGWSGIYLNAGDSLGAVLQEPIMAATRTHEEGRGDIQENWWPSWRHERPPEALGRFWEDLDGFRNYLVGRIESRWRAFWPTIDEAVKKARQPAAV